jgi:hypothetical protein
MSRALFLAAVLLAVAASATTADCDRVLDAWLGSTELDLTEKWGPPQVSYEVDGEKVLVYSSSRNLYLESSDSITATVSRSNNIYMGPVGGRLVQNIRFTCRTEFEISGGRIVSWRHQGEDCIVIP